MQTKDLYNTVVCASAPVYDYYMFAVQSTAEIDPVSSVVDSLDA